MKRSSYPPPRERLPSVWCARFMLCGGIDVSGCKFGGAPELCDACERERLAALDLLARAGEEVDEPTVLDTTEGDNP
jgi:hypothetical protein